MGFSIQVTATKYEKHGVVQAAIYIQCLYLAKAWIVSVENGAYKHVVADTISMTADRLGHLDQSLRKDGYVFVSTEKDSFELERSGRFVGSLVKANLFLLNYIDRDSEVTDILQMVFSSFDRHNNSETKEDEIYGGNWATW